jgi:hypothetical protein
MPVSLLLIVRRRFLARTAAALIVLLIGACTSPHASVMAAEATKVSHKLDIRPNPKARWGGGIADVRAVLNSTAGELWRYFPKRQLKPILVEPKGGPIVLFRRGPKGEYHVRLNTGNQLWAQLAYQFAHEMGHILCNYDEDQHRHKWFEESLAELASMFALRAMAKSWQTNPPYPNWKSYSKALDRYADQLLIDGKLPKDEKLVTWYKKNADALARNATDRPKNKIVAAALLPLFEEHPERWEAITWLNDGKPKPSQTFAEFLTDWHNNAPPRHRPFVRQIAGKFGVSLGSDG